MRCIKYGVSLLLWACVGVGGVAYAGTASITAAAGGVGGGGGGGEVTNAGTFPVQETGAALTALQLLDNAIIAEDSASTNLEGLIKPGCVRTDTPGTGVGADGRWGALHCGATGGLQVEIIASSIGATTENEDGSLAFGTADMAETITKNYISDGVTWVRDLRDPCSRLAKTFINIDITTATTTELTSALAGASTNYYVCALHIVTTAANNVALVDDDSDNCASVTSGLAGGLTAAEGWNFAANSGIALGNGAASVFKTNGTNRVLCMVTSAATQLSGSIQVVAAP